MIMTMTKVNLKCWHGSKILASHTNWKISSIECNYMTMTEHFSSYLKWIHCFVALDKTIEHRWTALVDWPMLSLVITESHQQASKTISPSGMSTNSYSNIYTSKFKANCHKSYW